jgi:predicted ABC-type ATPase
MFSIECEHVLHGRSFSLETTLSGHSYLRALRLWRQQGYTIKIFFLSLASAEEAIMRVSERVAQGGHYIPDDIIHRRFWR